MGSGEEIRPSGGSAPEPAAHERSPFGDVPAEAVAPELVEAEETVAEVALAEGSEHPKHHSRLLERLHDRRHRHLERGYLYRIGFAIGGFTVLLAGIAMLVLPGPGLLVTAIGLAMLALEFAWAEKLLVRVVHRLEQAKDQTRRLFRRRRTQA